MGVSVESKRVSYVVCSKGLRRNIVTADLKYDSHPEINENRGGEKLGKRESRKGGEWVAGWRGGGAAGVGRNRPKPVAQKRMTSQPMDSQRGTFKYCPAQLGKDCL